ncbi:MAG: hypothetical protein IKU26_01195, partial [Clostridia bacterium]|nr:hypothetical protein [Clostridia bacterium]
MGRCYSCFRKIEDNVAVCPYCNHIVSYEATQPIYMVPGTVLQDRYILGEVVSAGGFGIIYKAWDSNLETIVAVKEFF